MIARTIRARFLILYRWLARTRGVWIRGLLCWSVGVAVCLVDSSAKYDLRFQLRGPQKTNSKIVLVYLEQDDWSELAGQERNLLRPLKEISAFTDSFFWNPKTWQKLIKNILQGHPQSVAVTFFFPVGSIGEPPNQLERPSLFDPKVFWASRLDNDGRALFPAFVTGYGRNSGLIDFFTDDDHVVRRFSSPLVQVPHLSLKVANLINPEIDEDSIYLSGESKTINFLGPQGSYPAINARDLLLQPQKSGEWLKGKTVIIGTRDLDGHLYTTPVGPLSRAEVLANVTDNIVFDKWIQRLPFWLMCIYLLGIVAAAVTILLIYPQGVAIVLLFWIGIIMTAGGFWIFDNHSIWIPLLAPLIELFVTYMVFLGYRLSQQENINWRLEQEKQYLKEIEQLKNNFVSLFSHDLKTPIAKIQAICDRLLPMPNSIEVQKGLQSLRQESSELHRYIQSILRVSRIESSDFRIQSEPADINELIFNVCQQLRTIADAKEIKVDTNLEPIFAIEMDSSLIQEVILNLVENAIKYSPPKSAVVISSREVGDQIIVTVTDCGPGILESEQNRIFEKFYRGTEHTHSTKGSGLGLYLVKYFVELHGGRVFVRSEKNKGTRFGFVLPINTPEVSVMESRYEQRSENSYS